MGVTGIRSGDPKRVFSALRKVDLSRVIPLPLKLAALRAAMVLGARTLLADEAGISYEKMRRALLNGAKAEDAELIEDAAERLGMVVRRGDVCVVCNRCPYYRAVIEYDDPLNEDGGVEYEIR